jgi:DNA processing protein
LTVVSDRQYRLLRLCAIRSPDRRSVDWSLLAREAQRDGGLDRLEAGEVLEDSKVAGDALARLRAGVAELDARAGFVAEQLAAAESVGARLVTVLDDDYPVNLRLIPNRPPFLFILGGPLVDDDVRSVAVVGTRKPTDAGRRRSERLARALVDAGVTVVSGLAAGIDTAAHRATLDAGGRPVAVIGTGVTQTYPKENTELHRLVADAGAVVSQFWPDTAPATYTFPRRNVVMSGLAQGTVVVEASATSGAKMQARLALEHHKQLWLLRSLVESEDWAHTYVTKRGAHIVEDVDDVLTQLADTERVIIKVEQRQLSLDVV